MVLHPYVYGNGELVHQIVRISIDIQASDNGTVFHLCGFVDELSSENFSCTPLYIQDNHNGGSVVFPALDYFSDCT